ncbi:hypothetical protein AAJCM20276_27340 [Acetobacter aceti]|uniref:Uncharacterized protein n=1 Tax=Acetobacter aceti TaxID=435 RepID=A0A6S6PM33_ACEAC|nr:hypothetical protein AAJCM20276_27340 [Acetobacter aceti]
MPDQPPNDAPQTVLAALPVALEMLVAVLLEPMAVMVRGVLTMRPADPCKT